MPSGGRNLPKLGVKAIGLKNGRIRLIDPGG